MKLKNALGMLAAVAVVNAVGAANSYATTVTSPTGTTVTPTIHAVNSPGGMTDIHNAIATISCDVTLEGKVESHGSGKAASGKVSVLTFATCTNSWHVTKVSGGSLSFSASDGYYAFLTSSGAKIQATRLGVTCTYETNNTSIGTVTGGSPAEIDAEASLPINSGESSGLCGAGNAGLTGSFLIDDPDSLFVDP